jgi:hypothetical protein
MQNTFVHLGLKLSVLFWFGNFQLSSHTFRNLHCLGAFLGFRNVSNFASFSSSFQFLVWKCETDTLAHSKTKIALVVHLYLWSINLERCDYYSIWFLSIFTYGSVVWLGCWWGRTELENKKKKSIKPRIKSRTLTYSP